MKNSPAPNLFFLGVIKFSGWFMLYMPVVKLFYVQNGLNNFQLFALHGIYSAVITVLEIPSGYVADIWGRRNSLILGTLLNFTGFGLYSIFHGFWGFMLAEIALGIGSSFISGSDSALLYDSLAQFGQEHQYMRYEGRISAMGNFSESLAGLTVSALMFLGLTNLRIAYYLQTLIAFTGIPAALLLWETKPALHFIPKQFSYILTIVKETLRDHKPLRNAVLFSALIGFSTLSMAWFAQIYFYSVHIPGKYFGVLWTTLNLTVGLGSLIAFRVERLLGRIRTSLLILVFIAGGFLFNALFMTVWATVMLFVFYAIRGIATPTLKNYIHTQASSPVRATVLSIRSLVIRLLYAVLGPFFGWISDVISLKVAFLMAGFSILLPGSFLIFLMLKSKKVR